jgi:ATP-binding cassette subfamily B protein
MGSGKTTLADLLLRLYDPPEGTVFLDGRDIFSYPLARLREGIAYVPQDGFLFSTTILDNIGFADQYPDRERAERCTRITAIHETVAAFPEGFDTEIGDRGVRLSGGQKQRIAIARMIYKDAPIQILDDSLSAVDTTTEKQIIRNLREREARTTIIISHRLSAVQHADEIIVLKDGRISERGSHQNLMALGGTYADQWLMQSGEAEDDGFHPDLASGYPDGELDTLEAELTEDAA